ncbi:hypothetical protein HDU86_002999 [Geranomyces michiganensis]|nr:hypothetical protein HDU86_002999 [Geranomyces michiganensis]
MSIKPLELLARGFDNVNLSGFVVKAASGRSFYFSKLVLTAYSEYFQHMLDGENYEECQKKEVSIQDVDEHLLEKCLEWMFTGRITLGVQPVTAKLLANLHTLADRLLISELVGQLFVRLKTLPVDEDSFEELYMFALQRDCMLIQERVYDFWTAEMAATSAAEAFYERLTGAQIAEFMSGCLRKRLDHVQEWHRSWVSPQWST